MENVGNLLDNVADALYVASEEMKGWSSFLHSVQENSRRFDVKPESPAIGAPDVKGSATKRSSLSGKSSKDPAAKKLKSEPVTRETKAKATKKTTSTRSAGTKSKLAATTPSRRSSRLRK